MRFPTLSQGRVDSVCKWTERGGRRKEGRVSRKLEQVEGESCHLLHLGRTGLRGGIRSVVLD